MSNHAPSPWIVRPASFTVYTHFDHRRLLKVADARQPLFTAECQEANAHLIAAAPDLMEAAQAMVDSFADCVKTELALSNFPALGGLIAAIAKAKGDLKQ